MWIDTHCHLDGDEFDADRDAVVARARAAGVSMMVMPTGHVDERDKAAAIARQHGFAYALGIHPLWLAGAQPSDVERLRAMVPAALDDPRFVAIGEIGIDLFEPGLDPARQQWFYREQLKVARDFGLPVIVHVRRSADLLLKHLRAIGVPGGIIHAFNGSEQQAEPVPRARVPARVRRRADLQRLAAHPPPRARAARRRVGAGDRRAVHPARVAAPRRQAERNEPVHLPRIAQELADLRGVSLAALAEQNRANAVAALPRLGAWLAASSR